MIPSNFENQFLTSKASGVTGPGGLGSEPAWSCSRRRVASGSGLMHQKIASINQSL
jgi:hypothetical protein